MADEIEIGTFYTVTGFIPDPTRRCDIDGLRYAERYQWQGDASTPRMAEDLAKADWHARADESGLDHASCPLFVTAVYEGKVPTLDTYARFLDPDMVGE